MLQSPADRVRWHSAGDEDGLTLIELLVAAGIFIAIMGIVVLVVQTFFNTEVNISTRARSSNQAMTAINQAELDLRNAIVPSGNTSPFTSVSQSSITFSSQDLTLSPISITMYTSPSTGICPCTLYEQITSGSTTTTRTVVAGLTSANVFSFLAIPSPGSTTLTPMSITSTTTTSSTLAEIGGVVVTLDVQPQAGQPNTAITSTVMLQNVLNAQGAG